MLSAETWWKHSESAPCVRAFSNPSVQASYSKPPVVIPTPLSIRQTFVRNLLRARHPQSRHAQDLVHNEPSMFVDFEWEETECQ